MGWTDAFKRGVQDPDGQAPSRLYRAHAVELRQVDELIGLVKGVLADGSICQGEVEFLLKWMQANQAVASKWPASALYPRIAEALSDGHMDPQEESEIMGLLIASVGSPSMPEAGDASSSTTLPLCAPMPDLTFSSKVFCFTGKFNSGTRDWCQSQVHDRGGLSTSTINKKLNFLVIGEIGSRDWLHSTHGLKIQKAVDYRSQGVPLHIISEQYWYERMSA